MNRIATGALVFFLGLAAHAVAENQPGAPPAGVEKLIAQLDNDDFETRESAFKKLVEIGAPAVPAMRKALEESKEKVDLASKARRFLDLFDGGGETVNGLKITLKADKETVQAGEALTFTALLANMTDKPLKVYVGSSNSGVAFEIGAAIHSLEKDPEDPGKLIAREPKCLRGVCGTGSRELFETIPALSAKAYVCEAQFGKDVGGLLIGKQKMFHFPMASKYRLCLFMRVIKEMDHEEHGLTHLLGQGRKEEAGVAVWTGEVRSNEVNIAARQENVP